MTSYEASAYTEQQVLEAMQKAGHASGVRRTIAELSTRGLTLTDIAQHLGLNPQRFWAYYQVWCRENAEPLRLNPDVKG